MGQKYSREELYKLVWSEPKATLAKKLGISDVGLGKICQKENIPVPPRGYWALKQAGKKVSQIRLPPRGLGQADTITIGDERGWRYGEPIGDLPPPPTFPEPLDEVVDRARKLIGKISIPKSLDNPHHLITKLLDQDEERRRKVATNRFYWDEPHFDAPAAKRRLRLINAIFCALTRAGCRPTCRGKNAEDLSVQVGDAWIAFTIAPTKASRRPDLLFDAGNSAAQQPLKISLNWRTACPEGIANDWIDVDGTRLETVLPEVVLSLVVHGELFHRANAQYRYDWLVERKAAQEETARKDRELAEQKVREERLRRANERKNHLYAQANAWKMAAQIREFVTAVAQHSEAVDALEELGRWAAWALSEADLLDPLRGKIQQIIAAEDLEVDGNQAPL